LVLSTWQAIGRDLDRTQSGHLSSGIARQLCWRRPGGGRRSIAPIRDLCHGR